MVSQLEVPPTMPESAGSVAASPIIIASDGSGSALVAMRAARELAEVSGAPVRLMSVVEPLAQVTDMPGLVSWPPVSAVEAPSIRAQHVRAEFRAIGGDDTAVPLDVNLGNPASVLARAAKEIGASLLVTGFGAGPSGQRLLGGETLIDLSQVTETPLLATSSFNWRPERVLIAIESELPGLNSSSIPTALFRTVKSVYCVHVKPVRAWPRALEARAAQSPDPEKEVPGRLRTLFGLPAEALVQGITLEGEASHEILDFATRFGIDLIVIGRRPRNLLQRMFNEGVGARILRRSRSSVLLLPPAPQRHDLRTISSSNPMEWAELLNEISVRNTGRRVRVEVDDLELGAQSEVNAFRFAGLSYDHRDERVALMLGGLNAKGRHISHGIGDVRSVDLHLDTEGGDECVRIAYGGGQMLISFLR